MQPPDDFRRGQWQGKIEESIRSQDNRIKSLAEDTKEQGHDIEDLRVELSTIRVKVALWSAIGAMIGTGLISIVVAVVAISLG